VQYREELILNVILFVTWVWGLKYGEELLLKGNVCCLGPGNAILRGISTEYYCVDSEGLGNAI